LLVNEERNQKTFEMWKLGRTIAETSVLLNIPKSTVGYYYKKFGKRPKNGLFYSSGVPETTRRTVESDQETVISILAKTLTMHRILEVFREEDYIKTYYFLAAIKLLIELNKYLKLTPEELRMLNEALNTGFKPSAQQASPLHQIPEKKGKSIQEIFGNKE
jgi:hypothetical protein